MRLTAVPREEAYERHVADALAGLHLVDETAGDIVDVGSGTGVPGLVLALVRPERAVHLVESVQKKAAALAAIAAELGADNVDVRAERAEDLGRGDGRDRFGLAVCRALAPPPVAVELCLPLVRAGGRLVIWAGETDAAAVAAAAARSAARWSGSSRRPASGARSSWSRRPAPTPERFPRRAGHGRQAPAAPADVRPRAVPCGAMSRIYALANQKGGVGKTTTAINVAACIAEAGARVLLVDFDPQANATTGLGLRPAARPLDLRPPARRLDARHHRRDLDARPLAGAGAPRPGRRRRRAAGREDRDRILGAALAQVGDEYPYVLVDCPPSLGMLTLNALAAANRLIVPVQCEYYALEGLAQLLETVELIRAKVNPKLSLTGLLLTMHDGRTRLAADVAREVRSHFGRRSSRASSRATCASPRRRRTAADLHLRPALDRRRGVLPRRARGGRAWLAPAHAASGAASSRCSIRPSRRQPLRPAPVDAIEPNPRQPRRSIDAEALGELTRSIAADGVVQPVVVRERPDGRYELIAGERRWRAARPPGLTTIPAVVRNAPDRDALRWRSSRTSFART